YRIAEGHYEQRGAVGILHLDSVVKDQPALAHLLAHHLADASHHLAPRGLDIGQLHPLVVANDDVVIDVEEIARHAAPPADWSMSPPEKCRRAKPPSQSPPLLDVEVVGIQAGDF